VSSRLSVLPRGAHLEDALDRFLPHALKDALGPLSRKADFVILRVPSLAEAPGEAMLAVARHVVLVVVPGVSTRTDIAAALSIVTAAGAQMLGAVVSAPAPRWSRRRIGRRRAARRIGGPVVSPGTQRPLPQSRATVRGGSASRPSPM
jgi:Mrp family chromosome partitioning ATPase